MNASDLTPGPGDLRAMMTIRAFETRLMAAPKPGFQLLSSGQEGVAVGLCRELGPKDALLTSGRSLGPALARGIPPRQLMAEVLGRATGPCKGHGGRGHVSAPGLGFFGAHAVVGGNLTIAAGVALAAQERGEGHIAVCLFGDGACGAGALHEALNLAALWRLPLLFVCDNNGYSVSTPVSQAVAAPRLADLAGPFGIPAEVADGMSCAAVAQAVRPMVARARAGGGPSFLECRSVRFSPHSSSSRETRPATELEDGRRRCPIEGLARTLIGAGTLTDTQVQALRRDVDEEAAAALAFALDSPPADGEGSLLDVG